MRLGLSFAAAHFLLTILLLAVHSDLVVILLAPLALLALFVAPSLSFSPLALILPLVFASVVWALLLFGMYALVRRFVRYRPSPGLTRLGRTAALIAVVAAFTYVLFGPVSGFAGDRIYGVLEPVVRLETGYQVRPLWLAISGACLVSWFFRCVSVPHCTPRNP